MKYMVVDAYSAGDENGNPEKLDMFINSIIMLTFSVLYIVCFIYSIKTSTSIILPILIVIITWWIPTLMLFIISISYKYIKNNKLIHLYFYELEEFMKIKEIPDDKFIVILDTNGAVLAEKKHKAEVDNFCYGFNTYKEIKKLCFKRSLNFSIIDENE